MDKKILTTEEIGALLTWTPSKNETELPPLKLRSPKKIRKFTQQEQPASQESSDRESPSPASSEEDRLIRDLLDSLGEAMIITNARGLILFENMPSRNLLEKPLSAIRNKPFGRAVILLDGSGSKRIDDPVKSCIKAKRMVTLPAGTRILRSDGSTVPVAGSASPILTPAGKIEGAVMNFHRIPDAPNRAENLSIQKRRVR